MSTTDSAIQPHERLRELLSSAQAQTCQVVATFLDIRGFSTFSARGESFDTALYLRSVFSAILDAHFPDVNFFKPTGDGLLLVHELPPDRTEIPTLVSSILARCVALVEDFGQLTADDIMVNFSVPERLGVGVARGSVTRLVADHLVLDYTGKCLNLAARLMDKARPFGVVFSDQHAASLMNPETTEYFSKDHVCIRGISEQEPIEIYITNGVEIVPADREPMTPSKYAWGEPERLHVDKVRELTNYGFYLPRAPRSYELASVDIDFPIFDNQGKSTGDVSHLRIQGKVEERPGGVIVRIPMRHVVEAIKNVPATTTTKFLGITKKTNVTFTPLCGPVDDE